MPQHKMTTEEFKEIILNKFGDKVEILSEYNGGTEPIDILYHCEKHGDINKTIHAKNIFANSFQPCKKCDLEMKSKKRLEGLNKGNEYYYNKLKVYAENKNGELLTKEWNKAKSLYKFRCEEGHIFENNADKILNNNQWCPYCSGRKGNFEDEIKQIIKSKNGELLSEYISSQKHVKVKCNIHNYEWDVMPSNIKKGRWCPVCNMKFSEKVAYDYLLDNKCKIIIQYIFDDLKSDNNEFYRFDFGIVDNKNVLLGIIEIDGYSHNNDLGTIKSDKIKNEYCIKNNIKLKRVIFKNNTLKFLNYESYYKYLNEQLKDFLSEIHNIDINKGA